MEQIKEFTEGFFRNLKCDVFWKDDFLNVGNVPKSFEDLVGRASPYVLSFVSGVGGGEFVGKGSLMLGAIVKYLAGAGKATLLKIDFDINPENEIRRRVGFRNCEVGSLSKSYKNSFFSRFSFVTSFNYLNESERVVSEVYVHGGKVVEGDLSGYTVVEGEDLVLDSEQVKRDYGIAKGHVVDLVKEKQDEISGSLKERVEFEIDRIGEHYDKALKEKGSDLNVKLDKVREAELELRGAESEEREVLRRRVERLRSGLVRVGEDEAVKKILKEREMTVRDAMHKYSLNVSRRLVNTTVIYYPVYMFKIFLRRSAYPKLRNAGAIGNRDAGKYFDVEYDPLTKSFGGLNCEACVKDLERVSLCDGGHISCEDCLDKCWDCGGVFCDKCLARSCKVCGRKLCQGCVRVCLSCGSRVCSTHFRKDGVSGEERCVNCLRACLRCHGMSEERFFGVARDGSKVCGKCLGDEKLRERLKEF